MTPKEKAAELYHKFFDRLVYETMSLNQKRVLDDDAKECAVICVDEILSDYEIFNKKNKSLKVSSFWQQVKTEIQLL